MNNVNNQNQNQQQMTQEELQKTQVLNLKDFEQVARFEKITSKKPAIIVAAMGIFSILVGTAFPVVQTLTAKEEPKQKIETTIEKKEVVDTESYLNCTYTSLNNADGTDTILNINLTFAEDKLVKSSKTFTINPTVGNPIGPNSIQAYIVGYQPFLVSQIPGYQMASTPAGAGLVVTSVVDLNVFDPLTLPELHKGNVATNVEYMLNTDKTAIEQDLITKGFTCQ